MSEANSTLFDKFKAWIHPNGESMFEVYVGPALPGMQPGPKYEFTQACIGATLDRENFKADRDNPVLLEKNVAHYLHIMSICREAGVAVPDLGPPPEAP